MVFVIKLSIQLSLLTELKFPDRYIPALLIRISIGVFLLMREVLCWYFKINARLGISKQILKELEMINGGDLK